MVSLRGKKYKSMVESQVGSAALLAEEKTDFEEPGVVTPSLLSGNEQGHGHKRARQENEGETSRDAGPTTGGKNKGRMYVGDVLEQFIDMLQAKDSYGLFFMPGNFETYDYKESISSPSDFATLRQKHKDGLYTAIEEFENDVNLVLKKPINSNPRESVPYKEARKLLAQANRSFKSFKKNPEAFEVELAAWHKKYFNS